MAAFFLSVFFLNTHNQATQKNLISELHQSEKPQENHVKSEPAKEQRAYFFEYLSISFKSTQCSVLLQLQKKYINSTLFSQNF